MGIQVGIMFANGARSAEPDHAAALARGAEAAGFESLWAVQHIVVPVEHDSEYPYSESGTIPGGPPSRTWPRTTASGRWPGSSSVS
jgi:alkanesulfonate monooxygenase SsuD/methylene tetrahydromethanopterin reductase-like flavin-dependent oxidoreductase (luciferase family)